MLIPAWHIALLALLYGLEYIWRAWQLKDRRYMYIGKAAGRLIVALVYFWFTFVPMDAEFRAVWIRWSLWIYFVIDLIFVALDHVMRWVTAKHAKHT